MDGDVSETQQYHHMNAGAHRRPPPQIGAPALIWQRGFWMPGDEARDRDLAKPHESRWKQCVDNTIAHLFRSIRLAPNVTACTSPNYDPAKDLLYLFNHKVIGLSESEFGLEVLPAQEKSVRHVVFSMRARFCGLWLTMSARLHHENFVILFALDFSAEVDEEVAEAPDLKRMSDDFQALHDLIVERYDSHRRRDADAGARSGPFDPTFPDDRTRSAALSRKLIARFKAFVDQVTVNACNPPCNGIPHSLSDFGDRFSDFIGIVYSIGVKPDRSLSFAYHPEDLGSLKMSAQVGGTDFNSQAGLDVLDAAWPVVIGADYKSEYDREHGDPEYVVASFNDGRTLYISSLGRLASDTSKQDFASLVYTLIVSYSSPWRLGRFIDKLHTAGTLRLSAMRDLDRINNASNQIDSIFRRLASDEAADSLFAGNENVEAEFAGIGSDMELGLAYRVGRSRYYVNSYNNTVSSLRPARVLGYQFYVDFIRSRVFDAFDYIDRVGTRYDRLKNEIEFRIGLLRRQEARNLQVATARQAHAAASLLEAAELLSVIPLTYYGGQLLIEMVAPLRQFDQFSWLPSENAVYYLVGFVVSVALATTSNALRRRRSVGARRPRRRGQFPRSHEPSALPVSAASHPADPIR